MLLISYKDPIHDLSGSYFYKKWVRFFNRNNEKQVFYFVNNFSVV